jgi:hypothetical protein
MGRKKHSDEDIQNWLSHLGTGISLIGTYVNAITHTRFRCINGHEWDAKPNKIKYGGKYVGKEKCPDGYTETLPIYLLEYIY